MAELGGSLDWYEECNLPISAWITNTDIIITVLPFYTGSDLPDYDSTISSNSETRTSICSGYCRLHLHRSLDFWVRISCFMELVWKMHELQSQQGSSRAGSVHFVSYAPSMRLAETRMRID